MSSRSRRQQQVLAILMKIFGPAMSAIQKRPFLALGAVGVATLLRRRQVAQAKRKARALMSADELAALKKKRGYIDKAFFKSLRKMLKIVMPSATSKEFILLCIHTAFLVSRTFVSLQVAKLDGAFAKTIVDQDSRMFAYTMVKWIALAVPATYINSMIRYLEAKLTIAFRTRLVDHCYDLYMKKEVYYRVENLDSRLANADQCLTEDVSKFCANLAHLHSQLSKPILDVVITTIQLVLLLRGDKASGPGADEIDAASARKGREAGAIAVAAMWATAEILQWASPPFGRLVAEQAKLEGELRFTHSRLITNAEEVAFYGGHETEHGILRAAYRRLVKHMNYLFKKRILYNMLEGFLMKYCWSAVGLIMIALPAFAKNNPSTLTIDAHGNTTGSSTSVAEASSRTEGFMTARHLLEQSADAIERIMSSYKEVTELAGYTSRVAEMVQVFEEVSRGKFMRHQIRAEDKVAIADGVGGEGGSGVGEGGDESGEEKELELTLIDAEAARSRVVVDELIRFDKVPIVTPNGDVLVEELSFEIQRGMHLLITGPNGCGKSSLFRTLGGIWPVMGGQLTKPASGQLFYIPQRPYLCVGSLRDQLIYPDSVADMKKKGLTDADLQEYMSWVDLNSIVRREGGWDKVNDWEDVLSGGEKQRLAMARVFYHKPLFAILDECTSAVSFDVEGIMYTHAKEEGITLLTVSHRKTLWKYHNYLLQFDGAGGWEFTQLDAEERVSLAEEKAQLEEALKDVPKMQERLAELCHVLGDDPVFGVG